MKPLSVFKAQGNMQADAMCPEGIWWPVFGCFFRSSSGYIARCSLMSV